MTPLKIAIILVGLVCAASAQNASATATVTLPASFFTKLIRDQIQSLRTAVNAGLEMKSNALNFSMAAANQLTSGIIGTKKAMLDMGAGLASSATQFGTSSAANGARILAGLAAPIPIANTFANMSANLASAALSGINSAAQTGISTGHAAGSSALNAVQTGVQSGTGMIGSVGNRVIDAKKSAVSTGFDMAQQGADMVGQAVETGINALNSAATSVSGMADNFAAMANNAATQAQASIPGVGASGSVAVSG